MKRLLVFISIISLIVFSTACSAKPAFDVTNVDEHVVNGNSIFAFDIFKAINSEDANENIFISPLSISTALTMTYNGAKEDTKEAMEKVLGFEGIDKALVNESYKNLIYYLENVDKKVTLNIGNSIWIREGELINKEFITDNERNFNAKISSIDFSDPSSADTINKWIKDETAGKIEKMITPPINPNVVMYLINAIYFKGAWTHAFNPKYTSNQSFNTYDGSIEKVKMMFRKGTYGYTKGDDYKAIRLPYGKDKTSMHIILPNEDIDINEFIKAMTAEKWNDIRNTLEETDDVELRFPRFKIEYGIKNLNDSLKSLGMEIAFSDNADFSGIKREKQLFISNVIHKAVVEVNEEGSEAAGATVVEIRESSMPLEPITFIADRPFMFMITDDVTGSILFMGKVLSI